MGRSSGVLSPSSALLVDNSSATSLVLVEAAHQEAKQKCFGTAPRIRTEWEHIDGEDPLSGRVTTQEAQWAVVVTMGIAAMREKLLAGKGLLWYTLCFYCFWGVVSASINYSSRFNDDDVFHKIFWACFLVGMTLQVAYLNHEMSGFASATAALYFLVSFAHLRIGYFVRRARGITTCLGLQTFFGGVLFVAVAIFSQAEESKEPFRIERIQEVPVEVVLLVVNVVLELVCVLIFIALNFKNHRDPSVTWDVPLSIDYIEARFESLHMTVIVCSFLFPIGLSGNFFISSTWSAISVVCANLYALILKLTVFDMQDIHNLGDGRSRHAIRRSRFSTILYIYFFPLGMLGIAFTGVGFVAAVENEPYHSLQLTRWLLCFGPALTWTVLSLTKALHCPMEPVVHWAKVAAMTFCAMFFLLPLIFDLSLGIAMSIVMGTVVFALLSQLVLERLLSTKKALPHGWQWRPPRLLKDWTNLREVIGPCLTSQEHFFTIMLAVVIFKLNQGLRETGNVMHWVLLFFAFYIVFSASILYAARFNDNDAAHKLIWSLYQIVFLFMLEGLSCTEDHIRYVLMAASSAAMFLLLSVGFFGRAATSGSRARFWMGSFALLYLCCDLAIFIFGPFLGSESFRKYILVGVLVTVVMLFDPFLFFVAKVCDNKQSWAVPMNVEYIISRFDQLMLEVLGTAMIVPCAFYPKKFDRPPVVLCCVVMTAILAVLLKIAILDAEPMIPNRHAMRRSNWSAHLFYFITPFILLGLCGLGAAMPLLTTSVGTKKGASRDLFAQHLAAWSGFVFWFSLASAKLLHSPLRSRFYHTLKVGMKCVASVLMLLPLALWMTDMEFVIFLSLVTGGVTVSLMMITYLS